ncbi:MerR family transcriptional regulator [Nocardia sp. NPDC003482]
MLIGELADRAGISARMLRYYERQGLVRAGRSANGYRVYDEGEVVVVRKIRELLALGFDLADAGAFVTCLRAGNRSGDECPDSVESLRRRLAEVEGAIAELTDVRERLRGQLAAADDAPRCELSQYLSEENR